MYKRDMVTRIVEKVESGKLSVNEASHKYHIHRMTIYRWLRDAGIDRSTKRNWKKIKNDLIEVSEK